jgi:hypothetical protein
MDFQHGRIFIADEFVSEPTAVMSPSSAWSFGAMLAKKTLSWLALLCFAREPPYPGPEALSFGHEQRPLHTPQ